MPLSEREGERERERGIALLALCLLKGLGKVCGLLLVKEEEKKTVGSHLE